jgi:histidyl-tRNA synthetase
MVRGLDYYCRTTFEFITGDLGAQAAVGGGGRYDGLVEQLGGPRNIPGIGFAMGIERLVLLLQQQTREQRRRIELDIFVAGLGAAASDLCYDLVHELRKNGFRVGMDHEGKSLKSQMKQADKAGSANVLIVGEDELAANSGVIRNMGTQEQQNIPLTADAVKEYLAGAL